MTDPFRPQFSGLGPSPIQDAPLGERMTELDPMGKIADNAATILAAIKAGGGKLSAADVREVTEDWTNGDRGAAIKVLRENHKLTTHKTSSGLEYRIPGRHHQVNSPDTSPNAGPSAALAPTEQARPQPTDSFELAQQIAEDRLAGKDGDSSHRAPLAAIAWPAQVYLSVPLVEAATDEVQLLAALDFVATHFASRLNATLPASAIARATNWLASKHQVQP